jgi:homoserine dehydrogenase
MKDLETRYYVRLLVDDRPGVMAQITQVFGDRGISLTAVEQHELPEGEKADAVPVMVLTHLAAEGRMQDALNELAGLDAIREHPVMIRVVEEHEEYAS